MKHHWHGNTLTVPGGYIRRGHVVDMEFVPELGQTVELGRVYTAYVLVEGSARTLQVGRFATVQEAKAQVADFNRARRALHTNRVLHD